MKDWKVWLLRRENWLAVALAATPILLWALLNLLSRHGPRFSVVWCMVLPSVSAVLLKVWCRWQRERAVREAPLPALLQRKLREHYPHLSHKDADLVGRGLRQFFLACVRANGQFVAMPSRVVDTMWHEFILHTRAYHAWCEITVGRFLHHTPAEVLGAQAKRNDGLRRAWFWACRDEGIDPRNPTRVPLLFALDGKLKIPGGLLYQPGTLRPADDSGDAAGGDGDVQWGTSFSDGSHPSESADAGSFGGSDSGGADGGDGGDGGGGCGGD